MFSIIEFGAARSHICATSTGSASPQKRLRRRLGNKSAFNIRMRSSIITTEGTENQTVNRFSRITRDGARSALGGRQYSDAPADQHRNWSWTLKSKVTSKVCEKRSWAAMSYL